MKRLGIILVLLCNTVLAEDGWDFPAKIEVTSPSLAVRSGPSMSYKIVGILQKGTVVTGNFLTDDIWIEIGRRNYISKKHVKFIETIKPSSTIEVQPEEPGEPPQVVNETPVATGVNPSQPSGLAHASPDEVVTSLSYWTAPLLLFLVLMVFSRWHINRLNRLKKTRNDRRIEKVETNPEFPIQQGEDLPAHRASATLDRNAPKSSPEPDLENYERALEAIAKYKNTIDRRYS